MLEAYFEEDYEKTALSQYLFLQCYLVIDCVRGRAQQLTWHMNKHASGQEVSNFGLFIYLSVSIAVTHYCGGGPLSLVTVVIFFLISLGRPASHQKKPKSDYVFDHVDIDSEDE